MAITIYKHGQGKWTRLLTAAGAGVLTLGGAAWMWDELEGKLGANDIYLQAGVAVALIVGIGAVLWWVLNKPRIADFMIATEIEMRKVNWPTRREVLGSTWVVICGTFLMAALLFIVNTFFGWFFLQIRILDASGG